MEWNTRIRNAFQGGPVPDDDVIEELAQHARATYDAARAEGCSEDDAHQRVGEHIAEWRASAPLLRRAPRYRAPLEPPPASSASMLAGVAQDARYAARLLTRQPRVATLVVLTLALGIGSTTALFGVVYGVLMKPLPWPHADRLVTLKETRGGKAPRFGSFSNAAYVAWREQASTIEEIAAWSARQVTVSGNGDPERIRVAAVSPALFRILGVHPAAGSFFSDADDTAKVTVLSEGLWRQRYGGDPAAVGRTILFDGEPYTISGVLPDADAFPDRQARAWVPFRVVPAGTGVLSLFEAVAKLRPGVTAAQAAAEGSARGRFAADTGMTTVAIFGGDGPVEVSATPLRDALTADVRRPLTVLLAAVVLLLVIATANVAGLQLARATARRRELAIRAAIGASGIRVVRQLIIENLFLGAIGGGVGIVLAWTLHRILPTLLPTDFPRASDLGVDRVVVAFAIGITLLASGLFGVLPALRVRRVNLVESLADDGVSPAGVSTRSGVARVRLLIIAGQVAIACVLLVGASLLGRSFLGLLHADRGYDATRVLLAPVPMGTPGHTPQRRVAVMEAVVERLASVPGVAHAAFTSETPLAPGGSTSSFSLPSHDPAVGSVSVQASPRVVSPAYFSTLGLQVIAGRPLQETDTGGAQPVLVVNDTFARRYLREGALGAQIPLGIFGDRHRGHATVVGVVEDVRYVGGAVSSLPEMYFPHRQVSAAFRSATATLLVRFEGDSRSVALAMRTAVRQADSSLVPGAVMSIEDRLLVTTLARPRLYAVLLGAFAVVAVTVAGVGLFGVLSFTVASRTRELGVRAALGARRIDLVALVVRQGLGVALVGVIAGLIGATWLARFLSALLYGITASDAVTFLAVPVILMMVAAVACVAPALRAARLDPLHALRSR